METDDCATCGAEIFEDDGIWYHARIEDFSHIARPVTGHMMEVTG